ncbi:MAG: Glu/Leu/Phe/Val dehydrogenase dimerization domain-containing protein [Nannocystaceae bacterium]
MPTTPLVDLDIAAFCRHMESLGQRRAFVVTGSDGRVVVSHPALAELAPWLTAGNPDYLAHEGLFFEVSRQTGALFGAFVHGTRRGQGQGGLRFWPYPSFGAFVRDGLRLSCGMTRKNALAGIWWGGGKGIIARPAGARYRDPEFRAQVYREYGEFVSSLGGCYITAEDAGTKALDMSSVFTTTRFTTCIPPAQGGSGNPSPATAKGVVCAMEGALDHQGLGTLAGKTIAMQGAGNVAAAMIGELLARGAAQVVATDISEPRCEEVRKRFTGQPVEIRCVAPDDCKIFGHACDILAPNALGGVLNPTTIPMIQAKIVCGAANNQLLDDVRDAQALRDRGIVYVPDFLCNRMGIVHCANEQYGQLSQDPAIERHFGREWENSVFRVTKQALRLAQQHGETTAAAANRLADELAQVEHPIWGHRSRAIIDDLVATDWHLAARESQ